MVVRSHERSRGRSTAFAVLAGISLAHLLNDTIQAVLPAIYPMFKSTFRLSFAEVGLITLTVQTTASLLQPLVGWVTDRRAMPYALVIGMGVTLTGVVLLSRAPAFSILLFAAAMMGVGSAVFHPESSRVARMASGGRPGLAQSVFQVGGNFGSSLGPLLAAFVIAPYGQPSIAWLALLAIPAMIVLARIGAWHRAQLSAAPAARAPRAVASVAAGPISRRRTVWCLVMLGALIFSKYLYLASLTSYYTFFLITKFHVSVRTSQIELFVFLAAVATGTIIGGPVGDRFGRKYVIWMSILGVLPFTLMLPHATLYWTPILTVIIGVILASAFSAIVVYAQELVPHRVGFVSGLFFGLAFGVAGVGAAVLGELADSRGIEAVYRLCAFLPAIGALAAFLPDLDSPHAPAR